MGERGSGPAAIRGPDAKQPVKIGPAQPSEAYRLSWSIIAGITSSVLASREDGSGGPEHL